MTNRARLYLIILAFKFIIANPVFMETSVIPQIDCHDLNENGHPDFIAVNSHDLPRSLYLMEFNGVEIETLWEYSMRKNSQGYFTHMIFDDYDNDGKNELIASAYQDGNREIFYVFTIDTENKIQAPKIMGISNSPFSITHPHKLYSMYQDLEGHHVFMLIQGSPNRLIVMCEYIDGKINFVGSLGSNFLKQYRGPLELALGNFDNDNIEDVFILSNGPKPEGYFIYSDGKEEKADLSNYPHFSLLYNRGVDINFDGSDDLLMIDKNGNLMSNAWGLESITLSNNVIRNIMLTLDNGLIQLNTINQLGEINHYTIDPLTKGILTSEHKLPEFTRPEYTEAYSLVTENSILIMNNGKNAEFWAFPLALELVTDIPSTIYFQKTSPDTPDTVVNIDDVYIHPIELDINRELLNFTEENLPIGMGFNLTDVQLEWMPNKSQLGFNEFSYFLEQREKEGLEMEIENDKKLVTQREKLLEEKKSFLIYVNDPVKFGNVENSLMIVNGKPFELIIPFNDDNIDASFKFQIIGLNENAEFKIFRSENKVSSDSMITAPENLTKENNPDTLLQAKSQLNINSRKSIFLWEPNLKQIEAQFSLMVSDGFSIDTLEIIATIHPKIDLSMNQTEFIATVNKPFSTSVLLEQVPSSKNFSYELLNAPENMRITPNGVINWIPLTTQVDDYSFNVEVTDGIDISNLQYNIFVNDPPIISSRPSIPFIINEADSFSFPLGSFDMNVNSKLTWKLLFGPKDMVLNYQGILKWGGNELDYHHYSIQLNDGIDSIKWDGTIYVNDPPSIISKPITFVSENDLYEYPLVVKDANISSPLDEGAENNINYKLINGPSGMEMKKHILQWDMEGKPPGEHMISIIVSDGIVDVPQEYKLLVNSSPTITSNDSITVKIGDTLSFQINANDLNLGDSLSYLLESMPLGMGMDGNGLITWTPSKSDIGQHYFNLNVKDKFGKSGTNQKLQIFVFDTPTFTGDLSIEAFVGIKYLAFLTAIDMFGEELRGESIIIEMSTIEDMDITEYANQFKWTPERTEIGDHEIQIRITDKYGFTKLHTHNISVYKNPCFQCDNKPTAIPPDTTAN